MQIVIEISEEQYRDIMDHKRWTPYPLNGYEASISEGVILPKGHGRLIDVDELKASIYMNDKNKYATHRDIDVTFDLLNKAPTVLKAKREAKR